MLCFTSRHYRLCAFDAASHENFIAGDGSLRYGFFDILMRMGFSDVEMMARADMLLMIDMDL